MSIACKSLLYWSSSFFAQQRGQSITLYLQSFFVLEFAHHLLKAVKACCGITDSLQDFWLEGRWYESGQKINMCVSYNPTHPD